MASDEEGRSGGTWIHPPASSCLAAAAGKKKLCQHGALSLRPEWCMPVSSLIVTQSLIVLLISGTQAKPMLYEGGDWNSLWWYPKQAAAPVLGTQVKVEDAAPRIPHLIFVPAGVPPEGGWPVIVFLHGQGESSPSPLEGLALQGPPQHAGRHATTLPFAVISPQKPMGSQFFDDDVASAIAATIRHYLATQPLDARRGHAT